MRIPCLVLVTIVTMLNVAGAAVPHPGVARSVGCYEVTIGEWRPAVALGRDQAYLTAPRAIELTTQLLLKPGVEDDWLVVRAVAGSTLGVHEAAYWEALKDDVVAITFTNWHSGLSLTLKYGPKEMNGTAHTFWDFPREIQTAPVSIRRVECEERRSNNGMQPSVSVVTPLAPRQAARRPARG